MLELMYERKDLFEISNIMPHGCRNVFRIPEHPVQEIKEMEEADGDSRVKKAGGCEEEKV